MRLSVQTAVLPSTIACLLVVVVDDDVDGADKTSCHLQESTRQID